jgi:glycosyltransferase involved in cell wall biosynthesis
MISYAQNLDDRTPSKSLSIPPANGKPAVLRIAHLTPTFFSPDSVVGGAERYVYNVAEAVQRAGATLSINPEQTIITVGPKEDEFTYRDLRIHVLRSESPFQNPMSAYSGQLWKALNQSDVVHVHQSLTTFGVYSTVVAKSLRKPVILTDLGGGDHRIMTNGRGLDLGDAVLSISQYAHSLIASKFSGIHEVIVGPVDTERFSPKLRPNRQYRSAICVGRIMPHKGIDRIIDAVPKNLKLRVVGRVHHQRYYKLLLTMSAGKDVEFILNADDKKLIDLYHDADLFIQGSTAKDIYGYTVHKPELMGLTTLEAMSCGLPAIVSEAGSLPELIGHSDFGLVFRNRDELAAHLNRFTSCVWPAQNAAGRARQHVIENYSYLAVVG